MKPKACSRRTFMTAVGVGCGAVLARGESDEPGRVVNRGPWVRELRITDLRVATFTGLPMSRVTVIRVDTNQGLSGYGEVRDGASPRYALMLKSRLLGENPCDVDRVFRKIKQFGGHGRQGGGVSAVEMALWDLVGKVYQVPAYQLLGGQFRDRFQLYADIDTDPDPATFAAQVRKRVQRGFTMLKMDLGLRLLDGISGTVNRVAGSGAGDGVPGPLAECELTAKGIEVLCVWVARAREVIGPEMPLAADHFGSIGVKSCIRLGRALEKFNLAWLEDMVPWYMTAQLREIRRAVALPILTGEDVYLKEPFAQLLQGGAVDLVHPDLMTAGGLMETKKIADMAQECGVATLLHFAGGPIGFMANLHVAAATENVRAVEYHAIDVAGWEDLVVGVAKPIVDKGWATVPAGPGLGVELDERACRSRLLEGTTYFGPTEEWNAPDSHDRPWS